MFRWWISGANARRSRPRRATCRRSCRRLDLRRALVAVVAIMTFLASITTGAVLLVSASAAEWQSEVASEITIQVRRRQGVTSTAMRRGVAAMQAQPASSRSAPSARRSPPSSWSRGSAAGVDRGIAGAARHRGAGAARHDARPHSAAQPGDASRTSASVDDHRAWIERMRSNDRATCLPASASWRW